MQERGANQVNAAKPVAMRRCRAMTRVYHAQAIADVGAPNETSELLFLVLFGPGGRTIAANLAWRRAAPRSQIPPLMSTLLHALQRQRLGTVAGGRFYSCTAKDDGSVDCWGWNL